MPGEKILVVDDAPQNLKLLRLILRDAGYEVLEAGNGPDALVTAAREHPAAVILDVRMPGMSGYDVCRSLRATPEFRALPIIMVTALSMPEERIKGIEAGATDFITKPFSKRELLARLSASLQLSGGECGGGVPVNEPVILADAGWRVLDATPMAAGYLGLSAMSARGLDFRRVLEQHAIVPPPGDVIWNFHLPASNGFNGFTVRETPVTAPDGRLVLRVITLREDVPTRAYA